MPNTIPDEFTQFDNKPCFVATSSGVPISIGRLKVTRFTLGSVGARVDLHFETEHMSCIMGVAAEKLPVLRTTWDGEAFKFNLPSGDKVWLPHLGERIEIAPEECSVEALPVAPPELIPPVLPAIKPIRK